MKKLVVGIVLIMGFVTVSAQEMVIKDKQTNEPIEHVQIDIIGKAFDPIFTNKEGKLTLIDCDVTDTLILSHILYGDHLLLYNTLRNNGFEVYLKENFIKMKTVDITSSREKAVSTPQKVKTLTQDEIRYESPANSASLRRRKPDNKGFRGQSGIACYRWGKNE